MRVRLVAVLALGVTCAEAQTVMDGSDAAISASDAALVRKSIGDSLMDPYGAQVRRLRAAAEGVCGEFNAKGPQGGYVGFRQFHVARKDALFMPFPGPGDMRRAMAGWIEHLCPGAGASR